MVRYLSRETPFLEMGDPTRRLHVLKFILTLVCVFFSLTVAAQSLAAVGDVNYISDELNVPLRSGPSTAHRILHRGLPSGTKLTVLAIDEEAGFTQVRTDSGLDGWVTSQYLTGTPIARVRLAAAEKRIQALKADLNKERDALASIQAEYKETEANNQALNSQVKALSQELAELRAEHPLSCSSGRIILQNQATGKKCTTPMAPVRWGFGPHWLSHRRGSQITTPKDQFFPLLVWNRFHLEELFETVGWVQENNYPIRGI